MANIDLRNRAPTVKRLPDFYLQVERMYDVLNNIPKSPAEILAACWLPLGSTDSQYTNCFLVDQRVEGQKGTGDKPTEDYPILFRTYRQLDSNNETGVGNADVNIGQDYIITVSQDYLQLSTGTAIYQVPGVTPAPSPWDATCVLKTEERTDDGTLRKINRKYVSAGEISVTNDFKYNNLLNLRTLVYLRTTPPTPSGFALIDQKIDFVIGCPLYTSTFAGVSGTGGVIDTSTEYFYSPDQGTHGVTRTTIKWIAPPSTSTNPTTGPGGSQLISIDKATSDGYCIWTAVYASGTGTVVTETESRNGGKLIIYKITAINAAPSTPSATIGGTVVLINATQRNGTRIEDGVVIYDYTWAEGNGTIDNVTEGRPDGSLVYTVTTLSATATAPAYPGAGTGYCTDLKQEAVSGYFVNRATWIKPPAADSYKKQINFEKPGSAVFTGSPPQLVLTPPVQLTLLVDVAVDYATTQISTVPFSISSYAKFYESYIPETNPTGGQSSPVTDTKSMGGFLAGASGISGTNSNYNGILCRSWQATLGSSTPSSFPTGLTALHVDNDPYLTDISGVKVYRRTLTTYTF